MTLGEFLAEWCCAGTKITVCLYTGDDVITMYNNIPCGSFKCDPSLGLPVCNVDVRKDGSLELTVDNTI